MGNALAAVVSMEGPWALHMACVAIAGAAAGWWLRRLTVAIPLSFLLGSAVAFGLSAVSSTGSMYWRECFWEPVFQRGLRSLDGEDATGLLMAWLLPLAVSATASVFVRRIKMADVERGSKLG